MNKQYLYTSFLILAVLTTLSCKKKESKECNDLNPFYYQIDQTCTGIGLGPTNEDPAIIVINSEEESKAILTVKDARGSSCFEIPEIIKTDFSKYTVIVGQKNVAGVVASMVSQSVIKNCKENSITYSATIKNGGYQALGRYIFAVRIAKQSSSVKYHFDIQLTN
ncbi:MAG: hypothetical protein WKF66_17240 [Pedobacter sp.]